MAPLQTQLENYVDAANCLRKSLELEDQRVIKVGLLTKIAGNYKKADDKAQAIGASQEAVDLIRELTGAKDIQAVKCLINLAATHDHFENKDDAKRLYQEYLDMYASENGQNGTESWAENDQYVKIKDVCENAIAALDEAPEEEGEGAAGEEEYYDEEGDDGY